jgi:membrane protease YdiL (CAAX protease family)
VTDDGPTDPRDPESAAPESPESPPARPGATTFTIEGRASPALFVIAWLASLLGLAIAVSGLLGGSLLLFGLVGPAFLSVGLIAACGNQAFERRARGAPYAGPSPFLAFATMVVLIVLVSFVVGFVLQAILGPGRDADAPIVELVSSLLTAAVFIGTVRLTVVGTGALSWGDMQIRRFDRRALSDAAGSAVLALPVIFVTGLLAAALFAIFQVTPEAPLPPTGTTGGLLLQLLVGAVIAPVSEEIVFRGFSITAWERGIGSNRAIVRASLLFALAHALGLEVPSDSTLFQMVGLVVTATAVRLPVAFVLGWVFVRRRSIWASIGLHATFNAILLILAHFAITAGGT